MTLPSERKPKKPNTASSLWKGDDVTYSGAHMRVRRAKGLPSEHLCVLCGDTAEDWSYRGGCPRELVSDKGKSKGCKYSPDASFYEPRCRTCHGHYDMVMRRAA